MRLYGSLQAALVTVAYPAVHGRVLLEKLEGAPGTHCAQTVCTS